MKLELDCIQEFRGDVDRWETGLGLSQLAVSKIMTLRKHMEENGSTREKGKK